MIDSPAPTDRASGGGPGGGAISRRSLITLAAAGVAGLVASGCSADGATDTGAPQGPGELAPDVAVATTALAEIRAVRAAVVSTITRFPATRAQLTPVDRMHEAHERALADAVPVRARDGSSTPAPQVVPRRRETALADLRTREQQLHDDLAGLALRAQSGDFARLLASMGAAVTQRLAVWT